MDHETVFSLLHDGRLRSISVGDDRDVTLGCRDVNGASVTIRLNRVLDLCANNFREGNIILDVEVHDSLEKLEEEAVRSLAQSDRPEHLRGYRERFQREGLTEELRVIVIQSSYGCELVAVARGEILVSSEATTAD